MNAAAKKMEDATSIETGYLTNEQIRLLAEIGFMAAGIGQSARAEKIFSAIAVLRPNTAAPYIGIAMARLNARDFEGAIRVLRDDGMKAVQDNAEIRVFLGLALGLANRAAESERVLRQVASENEASNAPEIAMARNILSGALTR
jgi:hypothetical protein